MVRNPYIVGGMLKDSEMFYGRGIALRRIRNYIGEGQSVAIIGMPKIGKSSLLYQLGAQTDKLPDDTVAVYVDVRDPACRTPADFFNAVLQSIDASVESSLAFPPVKRAAGFATHVQQFCDTGQCLVLLLDNVEAWASERAFNKRFFNALSDLNAESGVVFITASRKPPARFLRRASRTPFLSLFVVMELGTLDTTAASTLVVTPHRKARDNKPADIKDSFYILRVMGPHPFYLQLGARQYFDRVINEQPVDHDTLHDTFMSLAKPHYKEFWDALEGEEQEGVELLAQDMWNEEESWLKQLGERLIRRGVVIEKNRQLQIFSSLFAEMVASGELKDPPKIQVNIPVYTYTVILITFAIIVGGVTKITLSENLFWPVFLGVTFALTSVFILIDQLSGGRFLSSLAETLDDV